MKNKFIIPIIILILAISFILLYNLINKDNINVDDQVLTVNDVLVIDLGNRVDGELNLQSHLFKNYDEYKKFMINYNSKLVLTEKQFKNNDFVLDFQNYSSCTDEKEKKLSKIEIEQSVMNFTYDVYNKCGECEDNKNLAYIIPIKKNLLKELLPINPIYNNINTDISC